MISVDNIAVEFSGTTLFSNISFFINPTDRIALMGKNGAGKSTFLNIITGALTPDSGTIDIGETVVYGYYRQEGITFNPEERVIDVVKKRAERIDMGNGRVLSASQFLEYFLFTKKQQFF